MRQCPNGHFYDDTRNSVCPYCNSSSANVNVTNPMFQNQNRMNSQRVGATVPVYGSNGANNMGIGNQEIGKTMSMNQVTPADHERTMAVIKKQIGIDPVVGWLVCIEGTEKGRDYRIHSDNNFIGRSENMDICIKGDDTISRENHAIISYDSKDRIFYFAPGSGRSMLRINDKVALQTMELNTYDTIEIGNTKLLFVPFCGRDFNWV